MQADRALVAGDDGRERLRVRVDGEDGAHLLRAVVRGELVDERGRVERRDDARDAGKAQLIRSP